MKTNIGLTQKETSIIIPLLETLLASENVLNIKIRNYHWNVVWTSFGGMHKFFEGLYNDSAENIDEIAERIRMLGSKTQANMKFFLEKSFLTEETSLELTSTDMVKSLLSDTEKTIQELRNAIAVISETNDSWTEDFLIALMQKHEKSAWMLRSMVS